MSTVIKVENLAKSYIIGHQTERYQTLRDIITNNAVQFGKRLLHPFRASSGQPLLGVDSSEEFWALDDVSFDIQQGDRVGIIGRNGAGKSTLLKILSRITEPTRGKVSIKGRVASLLEVGTGFHPELNGRENIYLNGAILGMTKVDIKRKFDEIVAFAEVDKFLDTPVKRYSSGMYVRLAFSVAAHLEPEILIVDEVLAVGDVQFQKKCLGKMDDVGKSGRTVIFVSHNMKAVSHLCQRILLLNNGRLIRDSSDKASVINEYFLGGSDAPKTYWENDNKSYVDPYFTPMKLSLADVDGREIETPASNNQAIFVCIDGQIDLPNKALQVGYAIYGDNNDLLYWTFFTDMPEEDWPALGKGKFQFRSALPKRLLNEGTYRIELISAIYYQYWICEPEKNAPSVSLEIKGDLSSSPYFMVARPGQFSPIMNWEVENLS